MIIWQKWLDKKISERSIEDWLVAILVTDILIVREHFIELGNKQLEEAFQYLYTQRQKVRNSMATRTSYKDFLNSGEFFIMFDDIIKEAYRIHNLAQLYSLEEDRND